MPRLSGLFRLSRVFGVFRRQPKLRGRLLGGFGLMVTLTLVLAGFGAWQNSRVATQVAAMNVSAERNNKVAEATRLLQSLQAGQVAFGTEADLAQLKALRADLTKLENLLGGMESDNDPAAGTYTQMLASLGQYRLVISGYAQQMAVLRQSREQLAKDGQKMTFAAATVVSATGEVPQPLVAEAGVGVQARIGLVESGGWRFLATNDPNGPAQMARFENEVREALRRLAAVAGTDSDYVISVMQVTQRALDAFAQTFEAQSAARAGALEIAAKQLKPIMTEMQATLDERHTALEEMVATSRASTEATLARMQQLEVLAALAAFLAALPLALLTARGVTRPIGRLTAVLMQLSGGDRAVTVPDQHRRDEVGEMARAVEVLKNTAIAADQAAAEREADAALKIARAARLEDISRDFEADTTTLISGLTDAAQDMRGTAHGLSQTATAAGEQSGAVSEAAQEATSNVQTVAAAAEELACSIREISGQVTTSSKIAHQAAEEARRTDQTVAKLSEAAQRIGQVVQLINNIAGQTNLLALNATIEAARAGDAGKGFAVVASEVKSLAGQTARATEEIAAQVSAIQDATKLAVTAIGGIAQTINQLSSIGASVAAAVEEQGASTQEIARSVQQAAAGTQQVSDRIGHVQRGAGETGEAAGAVLQAADALGEQAHGLAGAVNRFMVAVRAA
jgi:methyl-accepting chemotaxis protein